MKTGPRIALAVATGYVLGRTKKMKLAIMVGGMMAGRRIATNPKEWLQQGVKFVGSSPQLSEFTGDIRSRLTDAAKTAAVAAASSKIDSFGENLGKRAASLRSPGSARDDGAEDQAGGHPRKGGRSADDDEADAVPRPRRGEDRKGQRSANVQARSGGSEESRERPSSSARRSAPSRQRGGSQREPAGGSAGRTRASEVGSKPEGSPTKRRKPGAGAGSRSPAPPKGVGARSRRDGPDG